MSSLNVAVRCELGDIALPSADESPAIRTPSFAEIYTKYFSFVWSMTRFMGVESTAIDDVVQDIFVIICERLHTLQHPEALRSWIFGIVRRAVSTHHRTQRSALITTGAMRVEPELIHPESPSPQQLVEQSERARLFLGLVSTLDPQKREVFLLSELEEMTAPEIAAATNVPLNTVYSRLRAARDELEEALQRHLARTQRRATYARLESRDR